MVLTRYGSKLRIPCFDIDSVLFDYNIDTLKLIIQEHNHEKDNTYYNCQPILRPVV